MQVDLRRRGLQSFHPAEFANAGEHLQLLLQVRQLDLSFNSLYTIRGLEGLTHLTVLNISNNGLRSLGGGLPLTLQELDASHNCLRTLENAALLPLQFLTSLNVSFNELEDLRGVPNVTAQLSYLDARSNRLSSLQGIEHCTQLRTLHAEANLLRGVTDVASLQCLPHLTAVFIAGNPLLLRKRLLHQLRLLLPPSVDQDDLPTTAPPSSVRSSTAPPPSVPDTSSVCSLENSALVPYTDAREGEGTQQVSLHASQLSSGPVSAHQSGPLLAPPDHHNTHRTTPPRTPAVTLSVKPAVSPVIATASRPPAHTAWATTRNAFSLTSTVTAASGGGLTTVVGGNNDSPTCPRRALPHEHRLGDSPASAISASPERFAGPPSMLATTAEANSSRLMHSAPPPGSSTASLLKLDKPQQQDRRSISSEKTRKGLSREELEERLVCVTAERDAYRRETIALRKEVADLQHRLAAREEEEYRKETAQQRQQHYSSSDLMPSAFSDPHSATLNSIPSPIPSRSTLSIDASQLKDAPFANMQQRQDHAAAATRPSPRILAVELSGHSSSAASEVGERAVDTLKRLDKADRTSNTHAIPPAPPPPSSYSQQRKTAALANANDRRAIAALFMAKLQNTSSK
ncbi:hypothetical protein ABL78_7357 [Leptomonas seymouri]|uniref:Leucine-rich repeat protein n=1 Tax=Leptomonas seymouri TaxID=5684 RepID=A0A0N1PBI0_LEPSE|nr:hypothetical protein ABL78_7357 [Leptomonas seymouri]|eukprot:KPI83604.1 hypothetical protein ABL78_7357 [Leptomonas seymouri]